MIQVKSLGCLNFAILHLLLNNVGNVRAGRNQFKPHMKQSISRLSPSYLKINSNFYYSKLNLSLFEDIA